MKSIVKIAAFAVAAMSLMVACKNAPEAVEEDTTPIEEVIEEVVEDTMPVIDTVEVAVEEPAAPAKKATTKKATVKKGKTEVTVTTTTTDDGHTLLQASGERPTGKLTLENKNKGGEKSMQVLNN